MNFSRCEGRDSDHRVGLLSNPNPRQTFSAFAHRMRKNIPSLICRPPPGPPFLTLLGSEETRSIGLDQKKGGRQKERLLLGMTEKGRMETSEAERRMAEGTI